MQTFRLKLEKAPATPKWELTWDESELAFKMPDGDVFFQAPHAVAHRYISFSDLYREQTIILTTPSGTVRFQKHKSAAIALKRYLDSPIGVDRDFCIAIRRQSIRIFFRGLGMFIVCGGLFALYCWYAFTAPDPPPGHWIRTFGVVIKGLLLVLMGFGLAGPLVCWSALRQWIRIARIQRRHSVALDPGPPLD